MFFYCNSDFGSQHGLSGADFLIYSCLCCLCAKTPWKGNYALLAQLSCCSSKTSAYRSCLYLQSRGLISVSQGLFHVLVRPPSFQYETPPFQYETPSFHYETISKEERTKEENINKRNNKVSIIDQPTDFLKRPFIPPTQEECYNFAQQNNIPKLVAQKWYYYQQQHSWTQSNGQPIGNWQPCLQGFALREHPSSPSTMHCAPSTVHSTQAALVRQYHEQERERRRREDAEYEANRSTHQAAAAAFFAKHGIK